MACSDKLPKMQPLRCVRSVLPPAVSTVVQCVKKKCYDHE
jgi:hypothetical protein